MKHQPCDRRHVRVPRRGDGPAVVIVGTGVAGITAAETLRANGFDGTITLFGDEPHLPYRRTALSKGILDGDLSDDRIRLRPSGYWDELGIQIIPSTRVVAVEPRARLIRLDDEFELGYHALLLATGGRARQLSTGTGDLLTLRTRADVDRIRRETASRPVVIVGGGLLGLEVAAALANAPTAGGLDITVVEEAPTLMPRVVPAEFGEAIAVLHRDRGIRILTGTSVASATPDAATLSDGTRLEGAVIAAVGMEPDVDLAIGAGLAVGPAGILVDGQLRTSEPGIYAAGDVAARAHPLTGAPMRAEQWLTATEHGRLAAMTIAADLGTPIPAPAPIPRVPLAWSMQFSANIQMVGWPDLANGFTMEVHTADGSGTCADGFAATVRCFDDDRLVGAVCLGRSGTGRALRAEIEATLESVSAA
ncbi:NAD(P)/FAD-dependent oxidoreductase [Gordonia aurantiaca]|uniref:NAD(P)/FAD-dependent oxidoreductase n=1 Tax=Gordonia sp. B21 TaxID=3151852 RepID=UPI003266431D